MSKSGEIAALINLIEDPDELVYQTITERFIEHGNPIIPILKEQLDFTEDLEVQRRIEEILFKISLTVLENSLENWNEFSENGMKHASIFISHFLDNETDKDDVLFELEKIKRSIWIEMNDYLTPLEEVNIINKILFSNFRFSGIKSKEIALNEFDFNKLLLSKKGNRFAMAALYSILCDMLGLEVKPVDIPNQNLLAYFSNDISIMEKSGDTILFFIDPMSGQIYTHKHILEYLKKTDNNLQIDLIEQITTKNYIKKWLYGIANFFKGTGELAKYSSIVQLADKFVEQ